MWSPCINGSAFKVPKFPLPPPPLWLLKFPNSLFKLSSTYIERSLIAPPVIFTQIFWANFSKKFLILRPWTLLEEFWTPCSTIILSRQRDENSPKIVGDHLDVHYLKRNVAPILRARMQSSFNCRRRLRYRSYMITWWLTSIEQFW